MSDKEFADDFVSKNEESICIMISAVKSFWKNLNEPVSSLQLPFQKKLLYNSLVSYGRL